MKNRKKLLSYLLIVSLLCSFGAAAFAIGTPSVDKQLKYLFRNLSSIKQDESASAWYYCITDFDHNGLLEIVAASANEAATDVLVWETASNGKSIKKCGFMLGADESYPDMLIDSADTYHYADTTEWNYVFSDYADKAVNFERVKCSISLLGGNFLYKLLARQSSELTDRFTIVSFYDANGNEISPEAFDSAEKSEFAGAERTSTCFGWFKMSEASKIDVLADSFKVFTGEKAPSENSVIHENDPQVQISEQTSPTEVPSAVSDDQTVPSEEIIVINTEEKNENPEIIQYDPSMQPKEELFYYNNGVLTDAAGTVVDINGKAVSDGKNSSIDQKNNSGVGNTKPGTGFTPEGQEIVFLTPAPQQNEIYEVIIPTPTPTPKPVFLSITRNPTNEIRKPGDTARFVACANAIDSLQWNFVDPNGNTVSVSSFMGRFPGCSVDSSSTTLSISNVSADMDGWGAYCTFYTKDGQSASTGTSYIVMK